MKIPGLVKTLLIVLLIPPLILVGLIAYVYLLIPSDKKIRGCFTATMNNVHLCPGSKDYVPLGKIAPVLKKTVVLTEDSAFFQHKGFDWSSIEKSARENVEKGHFVRGGSTITQQLAKNLFLSKEKTLFRKFLEGLITIKLEHSLTKNEILEKYMNVIELGKNVYGVKNAAQIYFKKSAADLSAAESAFLAMLLPNPVKYSTSFQKKELTQFAEARIRKILSDMHEYQRIDDETYQAALNQVPALFSPEKMSVLEPTLPPDSESLEPIDD